jgi:hypothetical protein
MIGQGYGVDVVSTQAHRPVLPEGLSSAREERLLWPAVSVRHVSLGQSRSAAASGAAGLSCLNRFPGIVTTRE